MNTQHPEAGKNWILGEDNICPATKEICDDECCPPGSICNLKSSNEFQSTPPSAPHEREAQGEGLEARIAAYNRGMESMKQTMDIELDFRNTIIDDLKQQLSAAQKRIDELEGLYKAACESEKQKDHHIIELDEKLTRIQSADLDKLWENNTASSTEHTLMYKDQFLAALNKLLQC